MPQCRTTGKLYTLLLLTLLISTGCNENNCLETLEKFSNQFETTQTDSLSVPSIEDYAKTEELNLDSIIKESLKVDTNQTNKSLTIILLKLYKSHLECCNQAYSLELDAPVVSTFLKLNGFYESKQVKSVPKELIGDMVWSSIAYDWLNGRASFLDDNYKTLINDPVIRKELSIIENNIYD